MSGAQELTYLVPLKWADSNGIDDLAEYLRGIAAEAEVVVVDGSPPEVFERHGRRLDRIARHLPVDAAEGDADGQGRRRRHRGRCRVA